MRIEELKSVLDLAEGGRVDAEGRTDGEGGFDDGRAGGTSGVEGAGAGVSDDVGRLGTTVDGGGGGGALEAMDTEDGTCTLEDKELPQLGFVLSVTPPPLYNVVKKVIVASLVSQFNVHCLASACSEYRPQNTRTADNKKLP